MEVKYNTHMTDPSEEKLASLEQAEEVLVGHKSYPACQECGDNQEEYLKALDFMYMLTEDL
eukprot:9904504-Prorocentrum_lima.AAC.1